MSGSNSWVGGRKKKVSGRLAVERCLFCHQFGVESHLGVAVGE